MRVPTLVLAVRSAPAEADSAGFMEEKERAAVRYSSATVIGCSALSRAVSISP